MITAGVDLGTRYVKVCVVKDGRILGADVRELAGEFRSVVRASERAALEQAGLFGFQVRKKAVTGFGAAAAGRALSRSGRILDEAACAARAVATLVPGARTVIDGGALFVRSAALSPEGHVLDRAVTEKCAAGSGRFLEMIASSLCVPLEEVSDVAAAAARPYRMSNSCAVFAESEVVSRVNQGVPGPELLAGILVAIAEKALTLANRSETGPPVVVVGGLGHIPAFTRTLGEVLGHQVSVIPMDPQLAAAYGAALLAGQGAAERVSGRAGRGP